MKVDYQTMLELIKQNVHEVDAAAQVWLYGSRARGEAMMIQIGMYWFFLRKRN